MALSHSLDYEAKQVNPMISAGQNTPTTAQTRLGMHTESLVQSTKRLAWISAEFSALFVNIFGHSATYCKEKQSEDKPVQEGTLNEFETALKDLNEIIGLLETDLTFMKEQNL